MFEVAMSNGLGGDTFLRNLTDGHTDVHTKGLTDGHSYVWKFRKFKVTNKGPFVCTDERTDERQTLVQN